MPCTRRSGKKATEDHTSAVASKSSDTAAPSTAKSLKERRKRTKSSLEPTITIQPTEANTPPATTKKARVAGPTRGRPMQLVLPREDDTATEDAPLDVVGDIGVTRAIGRKLQRSYDFQPRPRRGGTTTFGRPSVFVNPTPGADHIEGYFTGGETEEEWLDDAQLAEVSARFASRPEDKDSSDDEIATPGAVSPNIRSGSITPVGSAATSQEHTGGSGQDTTIVPKPMPIIPNPTTVIPNPTTIIPKPRATIPKPKAVIPNLTQDAGSDDTDIMFIPGTNKIALTNQRPLLRAVIQEAFENLRASLLFDNGFPTANVTPSLIRISLISAAQTLSPKASQIYLRLMNDHEYMGKMIRLPRARIPLFRGEIKDCCSTIIHASFSAVGSIQSVKEIVKRQLDDYNYTFPRAANADPLTGPPVRTRPYRNPWIISVIRDLFFAGGVNSYACRFRQRFPTSQNRDGMTVHEVPVAMVALVGTAFYAAIHQWHNGTYESIEFAASTYIDVYNGHVNTLSFIRIHKDATFHSIMADIYSQASTNMMDEGLPIAKLNLDELEA